MNLTTLIVISVIGTGISSIAIQIITVREFLSQFAGNEITISIALFCWLIVGGLGSLVSKYFSKRSVAVYSVIALAAALLPLVHISAIRLFRDILFIRGESPGLYPIFFFILVFSAPYAFLIGFLLPYSLSVIRSRDEAFTSGQLYITDNIGDIAGGALFSFLLVYLLSPFQAIVFTSSLLIVIALVLIIHAGKYLLFAVSLVPVAGFLLLALNTNVERATLENQYGPDIAVYRESPYGRLVLTREDGQYTIWESGTPTYSTYNITAAEEKIHYPLAQLDSVENVLLVGGGMGETMDEVLKYSPRRVDYVELDPALIGIARNAGLVGPGKGINTVSADGRRYIATSHGRYSAIILDLPEPDTFQVNRFYTSEFFSGCKKIMAEGGILSFSLLANPTYLSEEQIKKLSSIHNTAAAHFSRILLIPGEEIYFLAGDEELSADIPQRLAEKSINTSYIEGFYHGNVTKERIRLINESIDANEPLNTDFRPRVITIMFKEWFRKHGTSPHWLAAFLVAVIAGYISMIRKEEFVLFATGFAVMGAEMLILFTFQILYGYIYLKVGVVITSFLVGLLPGALLGNRWKSRGKDILLKAEAGILLLLIVYLVWAVFYQAMMPEFAFFLYGFFFSFLCGIQFPAAAELIGEEQSPASGLFAADLVGAGTGTLAVGTLLIPLLGIQSAVAVLILLKVVSSMILFKG
ncbi:MAG: fused MFS/spermidine synthase [Thermodesulfobacteriota bacterium]